MITASQVKELKTVLKAAPCFSEVELVEVRDEEAEVEFSVNLSTSLAVPFEEQVGDLVSARGPRPADNDIAAVLEALLLPHLSLDKFEIELEDDVDAESPVLPETVTLVVRISPVKKSKKGAKEGVKKAGNKNKTKTPKKKTVKTKTTKNKKSLSKSRLDVALMTDLVRKKAVRLRDERHRSLRAPRQEEAGPGGRRLRDSQRAARLRRAGPRPGDGPPGMAGDAGGGPGDERDGRRLGEDHLDQADARPAPQRQRAQDPHRQALHPQHDDRPGRGTWIGCAARAASSVRKDRPGLLARWTAC